MDDPLAEFRKFVEQVGWVGKAASVAGPVAVPTVPFFVSLIANSPLWPESPTVLAGFATLGTYVLEMIIYIYSFQRWRSMSQERLTNRLKLSIVASAILACLFGLYLYFFIHPMAGVGYSGEAMNHLQRHPAYNVWQMLAAFGNDENRVFTPTYLAIMRLGILVSWFLLFAALTFTFTVFVLLQRKGMKKNNQPNQVGPEKAVP